jgi:hypothetical protein
MVSKYPEIEGEDSAEKNGFFRGHGANTPQTAFTI